MMLRYEIKTGDKLLNEKARGQRDRVYKPLLRGMHCRKHPQTDTIVIFEPDGSYVKARIEACCQEFYDRIQAKLHQL